MFLQWFATYLIGIASLSVRGIATRPAVRERANNMYRAADRNAHAA